MELDYTLTPDAPGVKCFSGTITLECTGQDDSSHDPVETLWFSIPHPLSADNILGASLDTLDGDLHGLTLEKPLLPGNRAHITLHHNENGLPKYTDRPYGIYGRTRAGRIIPARVNQPGLYWDHLPEPVSPPHIADALIPQPETHKLRPGETFTRPEAVLWLPDTQEPLRSFDIAQWALATRAFARFQISDEHGWPLSAQVDTTLPAGGYKLEIDTTQGRLLAGDKAGLHAALATLTQWFCGERIQPVTIEDRPRFQYRGLHLDVSRHFVPIDEVQRLIRLCALYKINHFHWHLTDDEGWRLEIKRYPQLTETGAWRGPGHAIPPQMGSGGEPHGGYYSQTEVRDTVRLARALGVTLIPEIDTPGHARALLRAIPELVETNDHSEYVSVQHYRDNVLNPALPKTWTVITGILDEVVDLFPDTDIHLGSDEVPDGVWEHSPAAREKARALGLPNVRGLHGWFMRELENYCWTHHRRRISGWEEVIADHAVSQHTTVYSWQGVDAGREAAEAGYFVVMTPAQHCYLDLAFTDDTADPGYYWAGTVSAQDAYLFEPFDGMETATPDTRNRIRGMQACLWSELLDDADKRAFMLLPRLPAVAERAWSSARQRDFGDFHRRCLVHQTLWQQGGWHYRAPTLGW